MIARLNNPDNRNRPSDEMALRAHIRSALGKEASEEKVDSTVTKLVKAGTLVIGPSGKVDYRELTR